MTDLTKRLRSGAANIEPITLGGMRHDRRCLEAAAAIDVLNDRVALHDAMFLDLAKDKARILGLLADACGVMEAAGFALAAEYEPDDVLAQECSAILTRMKEEANKGSV